jgi:hypothetical protein
MQFEHWWHTICCNFSWLAMGICINLSNTLLLSHVHITSRIHFSLHLKSLSCYWYHFHTMFICCCLQNVDICFHCCINSVCIVRYMFTHQSNTNWPSSGIHVIIWLSLPANSWLVYNMISVSKQILIWIAHTRVCMFLCMIYLCKYCNWKNYIMHLRHVLQVMYIHVQWVLPWYYGA